MGIGRVSILATYGVYSMDGLWVANEVAMLSDCAIDVQSYLGTYIQVIS